MFAVSDKRFTTHCPIGEHQSKDLLEYLVQRRAFLRLIDEGLIAVVSANILTYHPGTTISRTHQKTNLDYHSLQTNRPPYIFFEEAYSGVVSALLNKDDIWFIHETAARRWVASRNRDEVNNDAEHQISEIGENQWS